jgi:hypothetical protein
MPSNSSRITAPRDLQDRLRQLPREAQADNDHYALCADPQAHGHAIETARQARPKTTPGRKLHYLWPQHPIMEWLGDRVLTHFGRHRAPCCKAASCARRTGLRPDEPGAQPQGPALLVEWQVATRVAGTGGRHFTLEPFDAFVARAGLKAGWLPNRGTRRKLACHRKQAAKAPARRR